MEIKITIPDNKVGKWEIKSFTLTEAQINYHNAREAIGKKRYIHKGAGFKKLLCYKEGLSADGIVVKSNATQEVSKYLPFIKIAEGDVLIFGLGLGMMVQALIEKEVVRSITIIESDEDLIRLSGTYYMNLSEKVIVIRANAFTYPVSGNYHAIWFDIWDHIAITNLPEMQKLKQRWHEHAAVLMCWAENECKALEMKNKAIEQENKALEKERKAKEKENSVLDLVKNKYRWW